MNSTKKCNGVMNNSKNKLNSKINWLFKMEPNTLTLKWGMKLKLAWNAN